MNECRQDLLFLRHPDIQSDVWATPATRAEQYLIDHHDAIQGRLKKKVFQHNPDGTLIRDGNGKPMILANLLQVAGF